MKGLTELEIHMSKKVPAVAFLDVMSSGAMSMRMLRSLLTGEE